MKFVRHSISNRLVFLRMLALLGSILILAGGLFIESKNPLFEDPWIFRWIIAVNGITIVLVSFISRTVARNFQYWIYLLVATCTIWIVYLAYLNDFHPRYVLSIIILFPGFSLVMKSR